MAIKVIKHGTKVFRAVCPICGCEFEYEYEDLKTEYGFVREVKCPDCGNIVYHQEYKPAYPNTPTWPYPNYPYITWTIAGGAELDCDKCINKPDPNKPVFGDTPCTWCKKNQPYCFTTNNSLSEAISKNYQINPDNFKLNNIVYTSVKDYQGPNFTTNYTAPESDKQVDYKYTTDIK